LLFAYAVFVFVFVLHPILFRRNCTRCMMMLFLLFVFVVVVAQVELIRHMNRYCLFINQHQHLYRKLFSPILLPSSSSSSVSLSYTVIVITCIDHPSSWFAWVLSLVFCVVLQYSVVHCSLLLIMHGAMRCVALLKFIVCFFLLSFSFHKKKNLLLLRNVVCCLLLVVGCGSECYWWIIRGI
jgi:hypothetical protein